MRAPTKDDPMFAEIERALMPGKYIRYSETCEFVQGLERVQEKLVALTTGGTEGAVRLYEVFLSGCYEKIEECDDSSAYLSMFFHGLFCSWIKARQVMGLSAEETVGQILKWKEHDNYGFCHRIEPEVVKALDPDGRRLFIAHFQGLIDKALSGTAPNQAKVMVEYSNDIRLPALSLKEIYLSGKSVAPYVALCDRLGFSPLDCEHLAEMEMSHKHWDQALVWAEKGLALEPTRNWHNESNHLLAQLRPKILAKVGRKEDALAAAWSKFESHPSELAYEELMACVPKGEKAHWHDEAMKTATKGGVGEFMSLCVKTKEWDRLAARIHATTHVELEAVSHYDSEPAAAGLAKRDMLAAAKLYRALGMRILNSKKSKYYDAALEHFQSARRIYLKAGGEAEWQAIVNVIQTEHSRKKGFLLGLGLIEAGKSPRGPSFAERAQERWRKQTL
jgi:tetratricopeptide (TPR) repeat protein